MKAFRAEMAQLFARDGEDGRNRRLAAVSPFPKTCFLLAFLVLVVSFPRHAACGCALFAVFPFAAAHLGGYSARGLLRRSLMALPFVLCAGLANLFFDRTPTVLFPGMSISGGVMSFAVLVCKTLASTGLVLLLASSTSPSGISGALLRLRLPCVFVLQIQLLLRYLPMTIVEARLVAHAYLLRNPGRSVIPMRDWGRVAGQLFVRCMVRADAVYHAMQCRLFHAGKPLPGNELGSLKEWGVCLVLLFILSVLRMSLA